MAGGPLEIERKYLLRSVPQVPPNAEVWRIEQGYFDFNAKPASPDPDGLDVGRIRRTTMPDGTVVCTHTVKSGVGLVRQEIEREISLEAFERAWPRTQGRRLRKVRHRVRDADLIWEIDVFASVDLALAEVELPTPDTPSPFPKWLQPCIDREVTGEPAYSNAAIAFRLGVGSSDDPVNN
jgi:adenylate cyclase